MNIPTSRHRFDLIVIGAGSGGLATSKRAASHGAKVAIIETSRVGGTCVIRGCIPKKLMMYASQLGYARQQAREYGWQDDLGDIDWTRLKTLRDNVVSNLESMHQRNLAKAGVTLFEGHAQFVSKREVKVGEDILEADKIVIATGARPIMPPVSGIEHCISSDGFWELEEQPKRATVVGGGYIGLELACAMQGLGTQTTLIVRSQLLRTFDQEIAEHLEGSLKKTGMQVIRGAALEEIQRENGEILVSYKTTDGDVHTVSSDAVALIATGRVPNPGGLDLEHAGISPGPSGEIVVNEHDETSTEGIFAVGDVTLRAMLTPVAIQAGRYLAERFYNQGKQVMRYDNIATAIFSQPPVGTIGLSEAAARELYADAIKIYRSEFGGLIYSPTPKEKTIRCLMKMVVHAETDKVLGCHMVGPDAPEIIQGFAAAIQAGATKADFDDTVAIHPSSAEEFVLMS